MSVPMKAEYEVYDANQYTIIPTYKKIEKVIKYTKSNSLNIWIFYIREATIIESIIYILD
jgi:hypothetical protein